jgi:ADP-heptose:LPS heptosyltransferase
VSPAKGKRPRLLALRALGLGDFLTGLPALRSLTEAFPEHERLLAAPEVLGPLVELSGCGFSLVDAGPLQPLPRRLERPQVAVNLHGCGPQSHRLLLATNPGRLIAFSHPGVPESAGSPLWRAEEHETRRWCRLLSETGIAADPEALLIDTPSLDVPDRLRNAVVLHPGASSRARQWPPERWAAVARAQALAGRHVVLTGGAAERRLAAGIAREAGLGQASVLAGQTTLLQLTALVSAATLVVCGDTGVAHLATALRAPSVVLFGPTSPARWGPPPGRCHRVLWKGATGDPHAAEPDAGLMGIAVGGVLEAIDQTLHEAGSAVLR